MPQVTILHTVTTVREISQSMFITLMLSVQ